MRKEHDQPNLDEILERVPEGRRAFLKRLLSGATAAIALPLILTEAAAQPAPPPPGKGFIGRAILKAAFEPAPPAPPSKGSWGGGKGSWSGGGSGKGSSGGGKGGKGSR